MARGGGAALRGGRWRCDHVAIAAPRALPSTPPLRRRCKVSRCRHRRHFVLLVVGCCDLMRACRLFVSSEGTFEAPSFLLWAASEERRNDWLRDNTPERRTSRFHAVGCRVLRGIVTTLPSSGMEGGGWRRDHVAIIACTIITALPLPHCHRVPGSEILSSCS